jgi:hypothetical protein
VTTVPERPDRFIRSLTVSTVVLAVTTSLGGSPLAGELISVTASAPSRARLTVLTMVICVHFLDVDFGLHQLSLSLAGKGVTL